MILLRLRLFFYPVFLLILYSCQQQEDDNFQEFENVPTFSLASIKKNYEGIYKPRDISGIGNHLIVAESRSADPDFPKIHVLEKTTLKYAFAKGKAGFGPLEIATASSIEPGFSDDTFLVYCSMNKKFVTFSLSDTSLLGIAEYKQPDELFGMYMKFHVNDSIVLGIMADEPNRLVEYSTITGKRVDGYGPWEKVPGVDHLIDYEDPDINYHLGEINIGRFRANRDLGLFVKALGFRDRIEIFHYPSKTFKIIEGPRKEVHPFTIKRSQGRSAVIFDLEYPFGYGDAEVSTKFIYALYSGLTDAQMMNSDELARIVYVFSHQGKLIGRLDLDRSIRDIAVDEELGKLYGITTDGDPWIAVFDLPDELFE
ncbi:BF3164 family lipoprotein [Algoriphagus namhaensis]